MIRFSSGKLSVNFLFAFLFVFISLSINLHAQAKKSTAAKAKTQTPSKKTTVKVKVADKKFSQTKTVDKKDSAAKIKSVQNDKNDKNDKLQKANLKRQAEEKRLAEIRQAEDARRRNIEDARRREIENARRQAALEERQRREQAMREARARKLAFERGLHTETTENIANDDTEGEDLEVRRAAVKALGKHAGMVVVMEPQTGKVLTIVNQDWAIRRGFKPCSTIKLVTGVAGLNEHLINEEGNIRSRKFPMNLDDALAFSNNTYFQKVGANLGNGKMISYAQSLGLGQPTGINSDNETSGKLPHKNKNARIYSHGDDFEVSPLQLAVMVSAISNGGKIVVPRIPTTKFDKTNFRGTMRRQVKLSENNLEGVIPGMVGAASYGTARRGVDASMGIAGKTGSCIGQGSWVGLFASVAPIENPKYAVIVITRGQAERGKYAAAIAGKIYQSLKYRMIDGVDKTLAKIPLELRPQTKVNAKTSAQLDTDEDEDSADNDAVKPLPKESAAVQPAPKTNPKKDLKPAELFPTVVVKVKKSGEQQTRPRIVQNK